MIELKQRTSELHEELVRLSTIHRTTLSTILEHLSEMNARKGFVEFGHPSLMKYCVKELGLSESAAYRRIKALRILDSNPEVKEKLSCGKVNLAQISRTQELFDICSQEKGKELPGYKKSEILEEIQNKSLHDSESLIREKLELPPKPKRITIEVSGETHALWIEYKGSMAHKNMTDEMLLCFAIKKAGCINEIKIPRKPRPHNENSRYIPAHIKRELFEISGYKCSWPGCESTYALEIDHIIPVSKGGKTVKENLRVLCRNHNQARNFQ